MKDTLYIKKILLERFNKFLVGGQKGMEAGILMIKSIDDISTETKKQISVESNIAEICFLEELSKNEYKVKYYKKDQKIPFCGHVSLACCDLLKKNIRLIYDENKFVDLIYSDNKSYMKINKEKTFCENLSENIKYNKDQDKYICKLNDINSLYSLDINKLDFYKNKGVFFYTIKNDKCLARFFRNTIEDPIHLSAIKILLNEENFNSVKFVQSGIDIDIDNKSDHFNITTEIVNKNVIAPKL